MKAAITDPVAVLGIDAAWTSSNPSGVSLWLRNRGRWKCMRVSPSYAGFCASNTDPWLHQANVPEILSTCNALTEGAPLAVVSVDMPIGKSPVTGRRPADNEVSRRFSSQHCATHSPSLTRPGEIGTRLSTEFSNAGFNPVFEENSTGPVLIEVYPHVSLLAIAQHGNADHSYDKNMRLPYKASKTTTYWKNIRSTTERKKRLIQVWRDILGRLEHFADLSVFRLPDDLENRSFEALKPYEDQIDALVCAWTAAQYLEGALAPLGNQTSAIWVPRELIK